MNSYENLSVKELDNVERNLMKQIERVRSERKSRSNGSESTSMLTMFKISLPSNKKDEEKKTKVKEVKVKEIKVKDTDDKPRAIKATISSMKEVLDYHHVTYPSNAKKDDLAKLLRENNLVREAEKKEAIKKDDK